MKLATGLAPVATTEPRPVRGLSFSFVIDATGRIMQLESGPALRELGWDEGLLGRSCVTAIACRDLSGTLLCDTCIAARRGRAGGPPWRRPVARMRANAGEVLARASEVRRLLRRRLRIEVTV